MDKISDVIRFPQRPGGSQTSGTPSLSESDRRSRASRCVSIMAACYRRDDAVDAEVYAAAMVAVLMEYPIEIVEHVTDPRTGLPRSLKWLPSVAEVAEACDHRLEAIRRHAEPAKAPLGKIPPPTPVNPHMWDDDNARARHERSFAQRNMGDA